MENQYIQEQVRLLMMRNVIDVLLGLCVLLGMGFWCWLILTVFMLINGDGGLPTMEEGWLSILCNFLLIPLGIIRSKLTQKIKSPE